MESYHYRPPPSHNDTYSISDPIHIYASQKNVWLAIDIKTYILIATRRDVIPLATATHVVTLE